jgi:hypothetical protein
MVIWLLLLPLVRAADWNDKETMELAGALVQYSVPWLLGIIYMTSLSTCNRGGSLEAVWFIFSFVQYVRWLGLMDLGQPPGFRYFMRTVSKTFDWYRVFPKQERDHDLDLFKTYGEFIYRINFYKLSV